MGRLRNEALTGQTPVQCFRRRTPTHASRPRTLPPTCHFLAPSVFGLTEGKPLCQLCGPGALSAGSRDLVIPPISGFAGLRFAFRCLRIVPDPSSKRN